MTGLGRDRLSPGAIRFLASRILESFWFVPLLMGIGGAALAFATLAAQGVVSSMAGLPFLPFLPVEIDKDTGRAILGTIAGATISAASVVYSLSLVIRVLAASSLGPRLVQSFRRNSITRIALGAQLGVFVYALVTLFQVGLVDRLHALEIIVAIASVVVAMALLVIFVNAIADQSTVDQIVGRIAGQLDRVIEARQTGANRPAEAVDRPHAAAPPSGPVVGAAGEGYVQVVAHAAMARDPVLAGRTIQLLVRPGDFVISRQPLARFDEGALPEAAVEAIRRRVVLGAERTVEQDPIQEFNLLLEVALRALSPSINDVFTAIACTHHLAGAIGRLDGEGLTEATVSVPGGAEVRPRAVPFEEIVDKVLNPLRSAAAPIPMMALVLLEALEALIATTDREEARVLYRHHADRVLADALSHADQKADRDDLERRGRQIARLSALSPEDAAERFIAGRLPPDGPPSEPAARDVFPA